ncbi:NAD-binding protein [Halomicrobium zhouii]|uniref:NAD-binding protein n=1 Tax=Halomicrobium zhouii TaxID=767519 RepID=UPI002481A103|nr:NAD-binding protein [Halomicrobium zhouii]
MICDDHVRIGDVGDATVFKLALQLRYAGQQAVDAEVVEFCRDNGVDPAPLNEFLELGVWDRYFTGEYEQAIQGLGGLEIWHKDVGYARQVARENGTALPLAAVVHEAYKATVRRVEEDEGHAAAVIEYWRTLNDAEDRDAR